MTRIPRLLTAFSLLLCLAAFAPAQDGQQYIIRSFKTIQLTGDFLAEGAHFADFDKDGHGDVVVGPYWYAGPDFQTRHEIYTAQRYDPKGYSQNFLTFTWDFDGDGYTDVLQVGWPGKESFWYRNPGKGVKEAGHWERHLALAVVDNESPMFADLTGDGKPELICMNGGYMGYASPDWDKPTQPWTFHRCSSKGPYQRYTHGIGYGDVNGDGRADLLEARGWWEQPASLKDDPEWKHHQVKFGQGGAQMFAYDADGDGDNDVITSIQAHGYGLAWLENVKGDGGEITFKEHRFMDDTPEKSPYNVKFSQVHALDLVDMDGDGLKDIITGKRWWAHGPGGDAEPMADPVIYWFKLVRNSPDAHAANGVDWIPYLIHKESGVGTQVAAGDINGDGMPDVVVGNKRGAFVHIQQAEKVNKQEFLDAQPKAVR